MTRTPRLVLFALTILALILAACGTKATGGESPVSTPTSGKQNNIVIIIAEDPPSFNPMVADTGYDALVMELVLLGLTDIDPNGKIFPELAADLPTVENGGVTVDEAAGSMSVTWKLRQDVQWQDGTPVSADDVLFTWKAINDPNTGSWMPGMDAIDSVEQVDKYTFTVNYSSIYPGYLSQFGGEQLAIWPAHYCKAEQGFSSWDCARQPLSDGPFVLKDWVEGDHMTFERNTNYFEAGKPSIDKITVQIVPDDSVRKTMMLNGDADIDMWINQNTAGDYNNSDTVRVSVSPTDRWVDRIFMNQAAKGTTDPAVTPHPILSDVRVRQAIRMAIDVDTISKQIFLGYSKPAWTEFFRPPYNQCDIPRPKFDPEAAKALLESAGWKDTDNDGVRECRGCGTAEDGYKMEMEFITYAEYGEPMILTQQFVAENLSKVGIKLNQTVVEGSVLWAAAVDNGIEQSGNFDIDMWDDGYSGVDPTNYISEQYSAEAATPDNGWNLARWQNDEFNALLQQAYTLDESKRQDVFCQMAKILDEQAPEILLFTISNMDAYSARMEGVQSNANDLITWNVADWTIK